MIKTGEFLMTGGHSSIQVTLFVTKETSPTPQMKRCAYTPKYGLIPSRNASVRKADTLSLLS